MLRVGLIAGFAIFLPSMAQAQSDIFRISCEGFDGTRVQYAGHPNSPAAQLRRLVKSEDGITGIRVAWIERSNRSPD
jgi:hypothetical protein